LFKRGEEGADLVVASRYMDGGSSHWPAIRGLISRSARFLTHLLLPPARSLSDPVSGYFLVRRSLVEGLDLSLPRYKLLLYILATRPGVRLVECPMTMRSRAGGRSKIASSDLRFAPRFLMELLQYVRLYRSSQGRRQSQNFKASLTSVLPEEIRVQGENTSLPTSASPSPIPDTTD
jgi:dolichol-phosphate mannosyltransferase